MIYSLEDRITAALAAAGANHSPAEVGQLVEYWRLLEQWRAGLNLTAWRTPEEFAEDGVRAALAPLVLGWQPPDGEIADVGSGAGNPGIPLAVAWPQREIVLIEPLTRRSAFLRHVVAALQLANVTVLQARAEVLGRQVGMRERFGLAISRAMAPVAAACELTLPLTHVGGEAWLYLGRADGAKLQEAREKLAFLGIEAHDVAVESAPEARETRALGRLRKSGACSGEYPRSAARMKRAPLF